MPKGIDEGDAFPRSLTATEREVLFAMIQHAGDSRWW